MQKQNSVSSIVHRLVRIIPLIIAVTMTAPVMAQGAGGVADPMSLRSTVDLFSRYTDLDPEQRVAIEGAHDRYLEAFEQLRDGEIQEFIDLTDQVEAGRSGVMPSLELMDELFNKWDNVNRRVAALDMRFFEELGTVLDGPQAYALARVGLVRGRERHLASNGMLSQSLGAGIDTAFWKIEPTEEEIITVDDILRGYEAVMPRLVEDHSKASVGMVRGIIENMNEAGFVNLTQEDMQNPEIIEDVMAAMQEAQRLAMQPMYESQTALEDRALSAAKGFRSRLSPDRWHRMKRLWVSAAFPGTGLGVTGGNELDVPRHARLVRAEIADDQDRVASLEAILLNWYAADDRQTDQLIEFARKQSAQEFLDPMNVGNIRPEAIYEVHAERREVAERAIRSLMELVSDPAVRAAIQKQIDEGGSVIVQAGMEIPIRPKQQEVDPKIEEDLARIGRARAMANIPVPISQEDLTLFGWLVGLDEGEQVIIEMLHDDYLDAWTDIVDVRIEEAALANGMNTQATPAEGAEEAMARIGGCLDAILKLDGRFFEEVESALGGESRRQGLEAMRIQRVFDRMQSISGSRFDSPIGMPVIEPVSPYRVLHELELEPAVLEQARIALIDRNADLRIVVEGAEHQRLESDAAFRIGIAPLYEGPQIPENASVEETMAISAAHSQRRFELEIENEILRRSLAAERREKVDAVVQESLMPALPTLDGLQMNVEMFERGWAGTRNIHNGLDIASKVLQLSDLDEDQAQMIETLLVDHLEREAGLIESFNLELSGKSGQDGQLRSKKGKFAFRRGEMQERLIQRMLVILTPEQVARIPILAERAG